jgi:hypothetical protein
MKPTGFLSSFFKLEHSAFQIELKLAQRSQAAALSHVMPIMDQLCESAALGLLDRNVKLILSIKRVASKEDLGRPLTFINNDITPVSVPNTIPKQRPSFRITYILLSNKNRFNHPMTWL